MPRTPVLLALLAAAPQPRSLLVDADGTIVRIWPDEAAPRRGLLRLGARVPYMGEAYGPGCDAPWYRVDPEGYACGETLTPTRDPPAASVEPRVPEGWLMPFVYGYARMDGARVYLRAEDVVVDDWDHEMDPGFGIALDTQVEVEGLPMWRTRRGRLIHASDLHISRPSEFTGVPFDEGVSMYGWVRVPRTYVQAAPGRTGRAATPEVVGRRTAFPVLERARVRGRDWLRVGPDRWVDGRDVRQTTLTARPEGIGPTERWIDVDRAGQTLVAYEGDRPVWGTLASTGRALRSTPAGVHRVWVKLATSNMDNFEDEEALELYSLEDVPWVMFFAKGVAVHGTFWHDRFGERRSHGCVNVSVRDARWLYEWAAPPLPVGWIAAFPTVRQPGTAVLVR